MVLEQPQCQLGYTSAQLARILEGRMEDFALWMDGQTIGVCDGWRWDYLGKVHHPTGCGPHGSVVYPGDLERYLRRRQTPLDLSPSRVC